MRKLIVLSLLAGGMITATQAMADYYRYNEELRKPGQTIQEAQREQQRYYQERMREKYGDIQHGYTVKNEPTQGPLALSDDQQSKIEALRQEKKNFDQRQRQEKHHFEKVYWEQVNQILTPKQARIMRMEHKLWRQKEHHGEFMLRKPKGERE